jgi:hypothetical protein
VTQSHRSILMRTRSMRPCATHAGFQGDGLPRRPSRCKAIVERVTATADRIEIRLSRAKIAAALKAEGASQRPDLDPVVVSIEAKLRRAGKEKRSDIKNGTRPRGLMARNSGVLSSPFDASRSFPW